MAIDVATLEIRIDTRDANRALSQLQNNLNGLNAPAQRATGVFGSMGAALGVLKGMIATVGFAALGKQLYDVGARAENLSSRFEILTGSSAAAQAKMEDIARAANLLGVDVRDTQESFAQFGLAAQASGKDLDWIQDQFLAVSIAGGKLGLSNEAMSRSFNALQQMLGKGTVQAEELKGQLGEAMPIALGTMAKELGLTNQELLELVGKGLLPADVAIEALGRGLQKLTGEMPDTELQGLQREFIRVKDEGVNFLNAIGNAGAYDLMHKGLLLVEDGLTLATNAVKQGSAALQPFKELALSAFNAAGDAARSLLGDWSDWQKTASNALSSVSSALSGLDWSGFKQSASNALSAFLDGFSGFYPAMDRLKSEFKSTFESLSSNFPSFRQILQSTVDGAAAGLGYLISALNSVGPAYTALVSKTTDALSSINSALRSVDWDGFKQSASNAITSFLNGFSGFGEVFNRFVTSAGAAFGAINQLIPTTGNIFSSFFDQLGKDFDRLSLVLDKIGPIVTGAFDAAASALDKFTGFIKTNATLEVEKYAMQWSTSVDLIQSDAERMPGFFESASNKIRSAMSGLGDILGPEFNRFIQDMQVNIATLPVIWRDTWDIVKASTNIAVSYLAEQISVFVLKSKGFFADIGAFFSETWSSSKILFADFINGIVGGFQSMVNTIATAARALPDALMPDGVIERLESAGSAMDNLKIDTEAMRGELDQSRQKNQEYQASIEDTIVKVREHGAIERDTMGNIIESRAANIRSVQDSVRAQLEEREAVTQVSDAYSRSQNVFDAVGNSLGYLSGNTQNAGQEMYIFRDAAGVATEQINYVEKSAQNAGDQLNTMKSDVSGVSETASDFGENVFYMSSQMEDSADKAKTLTAETIDLKAQTAETAGVFEAVTRSVDDLSGKTGVAGDKMYIFRDAANSVDVAASGSIVSLNGFSAASDGVSSSLSGVSTEAVVAAQSVLQTGNALIGLYQTLAEVQSYVTGVSVSVGAAAGDFLTLKSTANEAGTGIYVMRDAANDAAVGVGLFGDTSLTAGASTEDAKDKIAELKNHLNGGGSAGGGVSSAAREAAREMEQLASNVQGLKEKYDPTIQVTSNYKEEIILLNKARDAGLVSMDEYIELEGKIKDAYVDSTVGIENYRQKVEELKNTIDPNRKITSDYKEEVILLNTALKNGDITQTEYMTGLGYAQTELQKSYDQTASYRQQVINLNEEFQSGQISLDQYQAGIKNAQQSMVAATQSTTDLDFGIGNIVDNLLEGKPAFEGFGSSGADTFVKVGQMAKNFFTDFGENGFGAISNLTESFTGGITSLGASLASGPLNAILTTGLEKVAGNAGSVLAGGISGGISAALAGTSILTGGLGGVIMGGIGLLASKIGGLFEEKIHMTLESATSRFMKQTEYEQVNGTRFVIQTPFGNFGFTEASRDVDEFLTKSGGKFLEFVRDVDMAIAQNLRPEQIEAISEALEGFGRKGEEVSEHFVERLFVIFDTLDEDMETAARAIDGTMDEIAEAAVMMAEAFGVISQFTNSNVILDYNQQLAAANQTLGDVLQSTQQDMVAAILLYDKTAAGFTAIGEATQARYQAELIALDQIEQAMEQVRTMGASAVESINASVRTQEEQYDYLMKQTDELKAQIGTLTDPSEIANSTKEIYSSITSAWNLLTADEKKQMQSEFVSMIEAAQMAAEEQLVKVRQSIVEGHEGMAALLNLTFHDGGENVKLAIMTASEAMGINLTDVFGAGGVTASSAILTGLTMLGVDVAGIFGKEAGMMSATIRDDLQAGGFDFSSMLGEQGAILVSTMAAALDSAGIEIGKILGLQADYTNQQILEAMRNGTLNMVTGLIGAGDDVSNKIADSVDIAGTAFANDLEAKLNAGGIKFNDEFGNNINELVNNFRQEFSSGTTTLLNGLAADRTQFQALSKTMSDQFGSVFSTNISSLLTTMKQGGANFEQVFGAKNAQLLNTLMDGSDDLDKMLGTQADNFRVEIINAFLQGGAKIDEVFGRGTDDMFRALQSGSMSLDDVLTDEANLMKFQIIAAFAAAGGNLDEVFGKGAQDMLWGLVKGSEEMQQILSAAGIDLQGKLRWGLNKGGEEAAGMISGASAKSAEALRKAILTQPYKAPNPKTTRPVGESPNINDFFKKSFADGGMVPGSWNGRRGMAGDTVYAVLTPGEYVIPRDQTEKHLRILEAIREDNLPSYFRGGLVTATPMQSGETAASWANRVMADAMSRNTLALERMPLVVTQPIVQALNRVERAARDIERAVDRQYSTNRRAKTDEIV